MNTSKTSLFEIFRFKGSALLFSFTLFNLLVASFLGHKVPGVIADLSRNYDSKELFLGTLESLGWLFFAIYVNRFLYQFGLNKAVKHLVQNIRNLCYRSWLLTYDSLYEGKKSKKDVFPQGEVIARIMSDTQAIRELMTSGTFGILIDLFFVVSCLVGFIQLNSFSGVILAIVEVSAAIFLVWGSRYMRKIFHEVRKARGEVSQTVANVVGGMAETHYTNHNSYAFKKGWQSSNVYLSKILRANVWDASFYSLAESLYPLLLILVVFIFPYSNITEAAIIFAIIDLIQRSINPIKGIAGKIANIQRALTGITRINEFRSHLGTLPVSPESVENEKIDFTKLELSIDQFSYPQRREGQPPFEVRDVHFSGKKGELLGIVGFSGCGKSTVLNILAGNIIPEKAQIKIESSEDKILLFPGRGHEDILSYREKVGIVSQESHIFSESLFFNLSLGLASKEEFETFWKWVCERIPYLKNWGIQIDDKIQPSELSMGQRQLLSGIRACFLKKPVVLFDEVSSGLDNQLEEALRKLVLLVQEQSLTIIVAHRLETLLGADNIVVMDKGSIVAMGKHSALMQESELYKTFISELGLRKN